MVTVTGDQVALEDSVVVVGHPQQRRGCTALRMGEWCQSAGRTRACLSESDGVSQQCACMEARADCLLGFV